MNDQSGSVKKGKENKITDTAEHGSGKKDFTEKQITAKHEKESNKIYNVSKINRSNLLQNHGKTCDTAVYDFIWDGEKGICTCNQKISCDYFYISSSLIGD